MSLHYSRNSLHTILVLGSTMFNIFINDIDVMDAHLLSLQMTPNHGKEICGSCGRAVNTLEGRAAT